jgi:hypothetical protein
LIYQHGEAFFKAQFGQAGLLGLTTEGLDHAV